jgi:Uma2 family endonuclease
MLVAEPKRQSLTAGDYLSREEFLARWRQLPGVKFAELIEGVVYMPSPLSVDHGRNDSAVNFWLGHYFAFTPGCDIGTNCTWYMLDDAPQPDVHLRIDTEDGASWVEDRYLHGAPELIVESCVSSTSYDLHQKKDLYAAAGVKEYLAVLLETAEVRWHRLVGDSYQTVPCPPDGIIRSVVFPGLWLNVAALLANDLRALLETLEKGLASPEHQEFVARLGKAVVRE